MQVLHIFQGGPLPGLAFYLQEGFLGDNLLISPEGALRLPTTYDNHPSNPSTYSREDDLSTEDLM